MASLRVSLLRGLTLLILVGAAGAAPASGATGGAPLPGGVMPTVPEPSPLDAASPEATPSLEAQQVAVEPAVPALPELAAPARLAGDPVVSDITALAAPSAVAAVDGHVVVVRPRLGRSELVDLADPARPRTLLVSTRVFGQPSAGHDAAGRPIVVVSPCAGTDEVVLEHEVPRCPLRAIDLTTGSTWPLPSTTGALMGDLEADQLAFTRGSPAVGVRLYRRAGTEVAKPVALPTAAAMAGAPAPARPMPATLRASALDVDASGRIAIVLDLRALQPAAISSLWVRSAGGVWARPTTVRTGFTGQGTRHVLGPQLDRAGVTAYVEGVVDTPSYAGHWSAAGVATAQVNLRRSIGRTTILFGAAFDGGQLRFVDWLPGAPCGSEGAPACGVRTVGPLAPG